MPTPDPTLRLPPSTTPDHAMPPTDAGHFVDPDDDEDCRTGLIDRDRPEEDDE
jgi:hypothetical protein